MNHDIEIVIQPNRSWLSFDWKGFWHYRDLLFLLVRRDFVAKYKQTVLGPAWFVIQPLLTTVVFTIVFGKIARIPTNGIPPLLFYLCGLLVWAYFSQCLSGVSASLKANANLFAKVYFPRMIAPLSVLMSHFLFFLIQLSIFSGFYIYFKFFKMAGPAISPNGWLFLLPFLTLQAAALAFGAGLWIAALTVRYRDLQHLVSMLIQFWMYATPIIYPASAVPEKWRIVTMINPMASIVEAYRHAFFGAGIVNLGQVFISVVLTALVLFSGILIFNKVERTFVDTL